MLLWLALVLVMFTKLLVILKTSWFCRKYSKPQKENIKKPSEKCQTIQTARKNPILCVLLDFWTQNTMQKESMHLDF